jgi:hypothetical protein
MADTTKRAPTRNNRSAGHGWEREVAKELRNAGYPFAATTRSCNRRRDGEGIDFCNTDEAENGRMEDDIQAKDTTKIDWTLLTALERADKSKKPRRKVLIVKLGATKGLPARSFKGKFALMFMRDYLQLLKVYNIAKRVAKSEAPAAKQAYYELKEEFNK